MSSTLDEQHTKKTAHRFVERRPLHGKHFVNVGFERVQFAGHVTKVPKGCGVVSGPRRQQVLLVRIERQRVDAVTVAFRLDTRPRGACTIIPAETRHKHGKSLGFRQATQRWKGRTRSNGHHEEAIITDRTEQVFVVTMPCNVLRCRESWEANTSTAGQGSKTRTSTTPV